eukprot:CAMPEP_0196582480 /NCGR_PEP_ID=MMETSP1081-20130531/39043_1 /TAXON_ID=36882 /ORGANISM="Pyramimonas amylifera, Strain CCMP720" /LENGTH=295 /DNA_ID=CAMNT_0041903043 /DNA_START=135 /DNA_END=1022 /DNA_ORIENTATION=-
MNQFLASSSSAFQAQISTRSLASPASNARSTGLSSRAKTIFMGTGKFIVGGNWKCTGTIDSVNKLVNDLNSNSITADVDVVVAPPFLHIGMVKDILGAPYQLAAQNCWTGKGGAFTGEISAEMLLDFGVNWVIEGHSERRQLLKESDKCVGTKVKYAVDSGLKVIACIGESLEQREAGKTLEVCTTELQAIKDNLSEEDWSKIVIAYEPIWAIGTGKVATPEEAQEVHAGIRVWLSKNISPAIASSIRIQYGGSVNPGNCEALAKQEDIDGFLVGGASLKGADFVTICNAAQFSS